MPHARQKARPMPQRPGQSRLGLKPTQVSIQTAQTSYGQMAGGSGERRRERKRTTDRLAQREHRKRQKQYVEELEGRIELMMNSSDSDKNAALLKENASLRQEVLLPFL